MRATTRELLGAVLEEGSRRAAERFRHADPGGSVRARLLSVAEADVSVVREDEAFIEVLVREAMSFRPETYPLIEAHLAPYVTAVAGVLCDGVAAATVRDDTPVEQLALLFVGTLSMLYVQHWGSNGLWPTLEEIPALAVTAFLTGARVAAVSVAAELSEVFRIFLALPRVPIVGRWKWLTFLGAAALALVAGLSQLERRTPEDIVPTSPQEEQVSHDTEGPFPAS